MTKIEKIIMALMVACILCIVVAVNRISTQIENAGGMKHIIIQTGKEIKDIKRQIDSEAQIKALHTDLEDVVLIEEEDND